MRNTLLIVICMALGLCASMPVQGQERDSLAHRTYYTSDNFGNTLHEGLNASMDLSVYTTIGGRSHHSGMAQSLSAAYVSPLGKKGWLTVGGRISHFNDGGNNYASGAVWGELGYQFNDNLSATVYGQLAVGNTGYGLGYYSPYGWGGMGYSPWYGGWGNDAWGANYLDNVNRLGASLRWTPSPSFSMQVSVEKDWLPHSSVPSYSDRYKYSYPLQQP